MRSIFILSMSLLLFSHCQKRQNYDHIIRNVMIYDGKGGVPFKGDIGIHADSISYIGDLSSVEAPLVTDGKGLAAAPGFINMLSWATESLIADGRSQSDIRQGVTMEIFGEGSSMGPFTEAIRNREQAAQGDIKYPIDWLQLGEYLNQLEKRGISCNVASFVGATTIRDYVIGEENRAPTPEELEQMKKLVAEAMEQGAMGVGSSLIYPPAFFAKTEELIEMCKVASAYGGSYISHMRSEGNKLYEALEELIRISKEANIHAEIYHLKAAGRNNWTKMDSVIRRIELARNEGLSITANMYTYTAGATGLTAAFPPALQDGGFAQLRKRLMDPVIRKKMAAAMNTDAADWENLYYGAGGADNVLLLGFKQDSLKKYAGKTLREVAGIRGQTVEETAMDLIVQDSTRIGVAYFLMSEENVKKQMALPWMSFGSDEGSYSTEGVFLLSHAHPRAYGTFARVLGKYCREEKVLSLEQAIRKLSYLPATNLRLKRRGSLQAGNYADIVLFDPASVTDNASFESPHHYATGVQHVFVNGVMVLKNGDHTGAKPGRFIPGPGYKGQ